MTGRAVAAHLREMSRVLRPGGLYVVGISLSCYGEEDIEKICSGNLMRVWREAERTAAGS